MRLTLFSLVLFFGASLFADPVLPPLIAKGVYAFQGDFRINGHKHYELVQMDQAEGPAKVDRLKADGYFCFTKSDIQTICNKTIPVDQNDPVVKEQLPLNFGKMTVSFSEVMELELKYHSTGYRVWNAYQKALITRPRNGEMQTTLHTFIEYVTAWSDSAAYPGGSNNPDHDIFVPGRDSVGVNWNLSWQADSSQIDTYVVFVTLPKVE